MRPSATALLSCASTALAALFCPAPAAAQKVVTDESISVRDVAMTPLRDLNLATDPIPAVLLRARDEPYRAPAFDSCADIGSEIGDLDAVLGEDLDLLPQAERHGANVGQVAQSVLAWLIPYRGVIRSVSGASRHEREFKEAIAAGMMRRAYLKGLGQASGCPYPVRPAPPEMIAATILQREEARRAEREDEEETDGREVPVEPDLALSPGATAKR